MCLGLSLSLCLSLAFSLLAMAMAMACVCVAIMVVMDVFYFQNILIEFADTAKFGNIPKVFIRMKPNKKKKLRVAICDILKKYWGKQTIQIAFHNVVQQQEKLKQNDGMEGGLNGPQKKKN